MTEVAATFELQNPILDAGCGYRSNEPEICRFKLHDYYTVDGNAQYGPDFVGSIESMRFASNTFGTIVCTEVLEHVKDERAAVGELHRVLRPGGLLIVTVPFAVPIHENSASDDYRRFTPKGLLLLLKDFDRVMCETRGDVRMPPSVFAVMRKRVRQ